jgi:NAD(P)-dependent dehydrogenase (short-subunit alcohol dehydrogenase family)
MSGLRDVDLTGQTALITGGGHGIGEGIAKALAELGAAVTINDLIEERATAVASAVNDSGGKAAGIAGDVSHFEDVDRIVRFASDTFGPIDILVNNAAVFCHKSFVDHTVEDWDAVFSVNVRGTFLFCNRVLPDMIRRRKGNIVNIASISAFNTTTEHVAYAASKAAIVTMTRDIASEVAKFGVRVNAVAPGPIDSHGVHTRPFAGVLLERVGKPSDIANAVAFLVSDAGGFVAGETLAVAGGSDLKVDR